MDVMNIGMIGCIPRYCTNMRIMNKHTKLKDGSMHGPSCCMLYNGPLARSRLNHDPRSEKQRQHSEGYILSYKTYSESTVARLVVGGLAG